MTEYKKKLLSKISNKNLKICIVGLGYVGLPLVFSFAFAGFKVIGLDNDKNKINQGWTTKIREKHPAYL